MKVVEDSLFLLFFTGVGAVSATHVARARALALQS